MVACLAVLLPVALVVARQVALQVALQKVAVVVAHQEVVRPAATLPLMIPEVAAVLLTETVLAPQTMALYQAVLHREVEQVADFAKRSEACSAQHQAWASVAPYAVAQAAERASGFAIEMEQRSFDREFFQTPT